MAFPGLLPSSSASETGDSVAAPLKTLSGTLRRELVRGDTSEVIWGDFYYTFPDMFYLHVRYPVNQIVFFRKGSMLIFYPDERRAFEIKGDERLTLPFVQAFQVLNSDSGLSELGYRLVKSEGRADTLVTRWVPEGKKTIGGVIIRKVKDRVSSLTVMDRDGNRVAETFYSDYLRYGSVDIPGKITSLSYTRRDTLRETITYSGIELNPEIPEGIAHFKLPKGVKAEIIKWK